MTIDRIKVVGGGWTGKEGVAPPSAMQSLRYLGKGKTGRGEMRRVCDQTARCLSILRGTHGAMLASPAKNTAGGGRWRERWSVMWTRDMKVGNMSQQHEEQWSGGGSSEDGRVSSMWDGTFLLAT